MSLPPTNTASALDLEAEARGLVQRGTSGLAPKFAAAVIRALTRCNAEGFDAIIYESVRGDRLQRIYFELGRSKAATAEHSWHRYGLAVDVIGRRREWSAWSDATWRERVVAIFKDEGCDWGGDWQSFPDMPHFQWGRCKASPSDEARTLLHEGGVEAVWRAVGAAA